MATWLVLNQFRSSKAGSTFNEGDRIDDTQLDLPKLQKGGLAAVLYDDPSMGAALTAFKSNPNRQPGDLVALLIASGGDVTKAYVDAGDAATLAAAKAYTDQPGFRTVPGASDATVIGDIGKAVLYTGAGAIAIAASDLSAAAKPLQLQTILLEYEDPAAAPVITPTGAGVTLRWPGGTGAFTPPVGVGRNTLTSSDGLAWTVT